MASSMGVIEEVMVDIGLVNAVLAILRNIHGILQLFYQRHQHQLCNRVYIRSTGLPCKISNLVSIARMGLQQAILECDW